MVIMHEGSLSSSSEEWWFDNGGSEWDGESNEENFKIQNDDALMVNIQNKTEI